MTVIKTTTSTVEQTVCT